MKTSLRTLIAVALLAFGCLTAATAQVNTNNAAPVTLPVPPSFLSLDFLTNLPTATNFQSATLGLNVGALTKNGGVDNFLKLDYYVHTNWMVSGETLISPSSTVIDGFSLYGGYRKAWDNAEIYGQFLFRRNFTTDATGTRPSFQGGVLFGGAWLPMTGGKFMLVGETEFTSSPTGNALSERPGFGARVATKILF